MSELLVHDIEANKANTAIFTGEHSKDEVLKYYANWAPTGKYDEHLSLKNGYRGPTIAATEAAKLYETHRRPTVKILDVAAGTGQVAEELRLLGFKDIDALDPSEPMLAQAKKKNLYNNYICDFLNESAMPAFNDFYDCITVSGGFGKSHIPVDALYDLVRLTKKGGHVIIVMREEYMYMSCYKDILEPLMQKLEADKKWKMLARSVVPDYVFQKAGLLFVFEV